MTDKSEKTVDLQEILGIGGEGVVLGKKLSKKEHKFGKQLNEQKERQVAIKFVKFKKDENEDFEGPEEEDESGDYGGLNQNGKWVRSHYFLRLYQLGDFSAATYALGGYSRPYIDFAISKIHGNYFYVIGKFKYLNISIRITNSIFINVFICQLCIRNRFL